MYKAQETVVATLGERQDASFVLDPVPSGRKVHRSTLGERARVMLAASWWQIVGDCFNLSHFFTHSKYFLQQQAFVS